MKRNGEIQGGRRKRRGNGGGTLRKIGNTFFAIFTVVGVDGKKRRVTKTTGKHTLDEAREVLNDLAAEYGVKDALRRDAAGRARFTEKLMRAQAVVAADAERMQREREALLEAMPALAVRDAWEAYEASGRRKANAANATTLAAYETWFRRFEKWMAKNHPETVELRGVTPTMARGFCKSLETKMRGVSINRVITLFTKIWNTLKKDDRDKAAGEKTPHLRMARLVENPWIEVERYDSVGHTRRELTVEELGRVVAGLEGEMRLLFALGIYTGLRLGDCATLEWSAVDLVRGRITVEPRKTRRHTRGKRIAIPIAPVLGGLLAERMAKHLAERSSAITTEKYVMPEIAELHDKHYANLHTRIKAVFERAGIETSKTSEGETRAHTEVGFHSLRHTFVSLSANAGTPLAVVQSIVGHASSAMTQRYYHENEGAMRGAVGMLPDVMAAGCKETGCKETGANPRTPCNGERLERFKALWSEMSEAERDAARGWIRQPDGLGES